MHGAGLVIGMCQVHNMYRLRIPLPTHVLELQLAQVEQGGHEREWLTGLKVLLRNHALPQAAEARKAGNIGQPILKQGELLKSRPAIGGLEVADDNTPQVQLYEVGKAAEDIRVYIIVLVGKAGIEIQLRECRKEHQTATFVPTPQSSAAA